MSERLRPLRWWDVASLVPLERQLFDADAWSAETWWGELAQGARRWYRVVELAERPGEVAGYAGVALNGPDADVMTVAVAPWAQGRGVGGVLVRALVGAASQAGAAQLVLEVRADNAAAQRVYARHGFERIAVRRGYYDGIDAWVMRLRPVRAVTAGMGSVAT